MGERAASLELQVVARTAPELIERICRVVRQRGGRIDRLSSESSVDGITRMQLTVTLGRDAGLLARQVQRVHDVQTVEIIDQSVEIIDSLAARPNH